MRARPGLCRRARARRAHLCFLLYNTVAVQVIESSFRPSTTRLTIPDFLPSNVEQIGELASTPRSRGRSQTFSQLATPLKSPANEKSPSGVTRLASLVSENSLKPDKARQETRKLLSHILNELQKRPRPPSVWNTYRSEYVGAGARRAGVRSNGAKDGHGWIGTGDKTFRSRSLSLAESDSDDELSSLFSPGITFDLLNKLKDVLFMSKLKGWHIFDDGSCAGELHMDSAEKPSSFRFRRSSFQSSGRRPRSFSPSRSKKSSSGLLSKYIVVLGSIVLEDCRFQMTSLRLARPPNALQALTLDVSQILVHMYRDNPRVLHDIGLAVVPAFSSFPETMHGRLLSFFEDRILRSMLQDLGGIQRGPSASPGGSSLPGDHDAKTQAPPIVAIQVDEAQDESFTAPSLNRGWQQWSPPNVVFQGVLSSNAPAQSQEIYYLSSVIGPLLASILDNVDLSTQDLILGHRLHRFFQFLADYKPDLPLNLLEIIAYHSAQARYSALCLLQTFWKAFGHLGISTPFPLITYSETIQSAGLPRSKQGVVAHAHQFVPWHFAPSPSSVLFEGLSMHDCHSCLKQINDFGLLCPFCMCAVHSNCYDSPDGSYLSHYPVSNEPSTQRVAVHRFSYVQPHRMGFEPEVLRKDHHSFRLANIFTLSLCGICHLPLWGHLAQGYRCGSCNQYAHSSCLHGEASDRLPSCYSEPDTSRITIEWAELRSSFTDFYRGFLLKEEDISNCTYEELSIYWSLLWIQLQLLKYGFASGSVIVTRRNRPTSLAAQAGDVDDFELHHFEKLCHAYMGSTRLRVSPMFQDLLKKNGYAPRYQLMLFDWPILLFITSVIKSSPAQEDEGGNEFLSIALSREDEIPGDLDMYPAEVVSVAHLRDALGHHFGLEQTQAACVMLGHLRHLGFFDSVDLPEGLFRTCDRPLEIECSFSLPLGLDISANVEYLIAAVESCLEDLNISVNEAGFLLLVRKLWPNGMASDYALARLTRAVLAWVLSEDDKLVIILREYVAKRKELPGVPSAADSRSWPDHTISRSVTSGSINNGNDYVTCRKALLTKYATRWLFALHCQNIELYTSLLFDTVSDVARDTTRNLDGIDFDDGSTKAKESLSCWADKVLLFIMKICQSSIAFSVVDDLLLRWLRLVSDVVSSHNPLPTLPRLFNRETEGSARWTFAFDATTAGFEHIGAPVMDPWRVVTSVASRDYEGLKKGLNWLCIFASSGVDIPVNTFLQVSALTRDLEASFEDHAVLGEATFMAIWIKSLGRQELQKMISDLHDRCANYILGQIDNKDVNQVYRFVRLTLSSFLLLYGCERARLQDLGMVEADDIEWLTSRRKVIKRASPVSDSSVENIDLVEILTRYVEKGTDELRCLIAKFLASFVTETSLLTSQELEAFILKNSYFLTRCVWKLYDMHAPVVNDLRTTLLLRILVVDTRPFERLLQQYLDADSAWENRFAAVTRLFQIVLDVTKPSFQVEGQNFRSSVMEVFYRFFPCVWSDEQEEIRLATDAWSQILQPAHHQSMALCFSELLTRAPIDDRLKLVSFLLQLRSQFPTWKVLSWDVVLETLMDDDFMRRNDVEECAISAHLSMYGIPSTPDHNVVQNKDPKVSNLQSSLILLSLQMIADGISVDIFSFLKIKLQFAVILGFSGATLVPAPSGHSFHVQFGDLESVSPCALPCIQGLMVLLDSHRPFRLPASAMISTGADDGTPYSLLVGSVVLDVFLILFNHMVENPREFPYLQMKAMLQTLVIVIYKHDVESVPLRHLREQLRKAAKGASDLLLQDIGYELRQLALTAIQAYRKRWLNYASSRDILLHQVQNVIKFISSSSTISDDILIGQAMALMEDILTLHSGTFYIFSKQPLGPETFSVLRLVMARNARNYNARTSLREVVFRDTLHALVSVQNDHVQKHVLENLRSYIEVVYNQGYSSESLTYAGESFVHIFRNASELTEEGFDPNPLLLSAATLIQYNKAQIREFLHHLEIAVRIALVRFNVSEQALRRLLQVTSTLYRRTALESSMSANERNSMVAVVIDVLSDGLRGKCRVTSPTLQAAINSVCIAGTTYLSNDVLIRLATDAFFYLQNMGPIDGNPQLGLNASRAVASLVLRAGDSDVGFMSQQLHDHAYEKSARHALTVRGWNVLALEALQCSPTGKPARHLFTHLPNFSVVYHTSLRSHTQAIGLPQDLTAFDVNQAFIAMKLWLLLSRKCTEELPTDSELVVLTMKDQASEERNASLVWNELWPPFERLVALSEADAEIGDVTPIATLVWSSVADIFLFLRSTRSHISLESSSHIATLNRVKSLGKGESFTGKFVRTVNSISEPPQEMNEAALIAQATHELLAAEKLHTLETRREIGRMLPDRSRRDVRIPTG